jgi:hypothetical protein
LKKDFLVAVGITDSLYFLVVFVAFAEDGNDAIGGRSLYLSLIHI